MGHALMDKRFSLALHLRDHGQSFRSPRNVAETTVPKKKRELVSFICCDVLNGCASSGGILLKPLMHSLYRMQLYGVRGLGMRQIVQNVDPMTSWPFRQICQQEFHSQNNQ